MTRSSPEQRSVHNQTYYEKNKEDRKRRNREAREAASAYINETKQGKPCMDCEQVFHPVCMDYDHVRGVKTCNVSQLGVNGMSKKKIDEEIAKCDLVCSNCHRLRTLERRTRVD